MTRQVVLLGCLLFGLVLGACRSQKTEETKTIPDLSMTQSRFNVKKDLLLLHYDCKTDVDDLHSVAAFASLIRTPAYQSLNYHVVAGTYGIQGGLYVPADTLFELSFGDQWSDAHGDREKALRDVILKMEPQMKRGGKIWIAEAGQSDFSAAIIDRLKKSFPQFDTVSKFNIVQHSDWNESVTDSTALAYVKELTNYHKIPDGNAEGNGSPGFNCTDIERNFEKLNTDVSAIWKLAVNLGDQFNGVEGRYLNKSIAAGGLDFSDFSEVHYILELDDMASCEDYLNWLEDI